MIQELKLFQQSISSIWRDSYISKNLLKAHLDFNNDAASRGVVSINNTIDWIIKRVPNKASILDLGSGPGLYAIELAKLGYKVTGVDFNKSSIEYAIDNNHIEGKTEYIYGDYLNESLNNSIYDSVLMIYCDFGALIPSEQEKILKKIYSLLPKDGVFIFDVFGKRLADIKKDKRNWYYSNGGDFWRENPYIMLEEVKNFPNSQAIGARYILIDEVTKEKTDYIMWDQYYDEKQIKTLLENNGFLVEEIEHSLVKENQFISNDVMFIKAKKI
ncbi:methyltransferase domain-containing protein [bacterium]|nr:methyltransferase domain-containing protein [bacterium]